MSIPSIKTLEDRFPGKGKVIRGLMDGSIPPDAFSFVRDWERQCFHPPSDAENIMEAINEVLDGYGVEGVDLSERWACFDYVNMGDAYSATVCYVPSEDRFIVTTWGDLVEYFERKGVKAA